MNDLETPTHANRLDVGMLMARLFWGPLCGLLALALFAAADHLGRGETYEELALVLGLVLGGSVAEAVVRRSAAAGLLCFLPAATISLLLCLLLRDQRGFQSVVACAGLAFGVAVSSARNDRSLKLALVVVVAALLGTTALAVTLAFSLRAAGSLTWILLTLLSGVFPHGAAGLALLVGYRRLGHAPRRLWSYSLQSLLIFYLLVGLEVSIAFARRTPDGASAGERVRFEELGRRARGGLLSTTQHQPLDRSITDLAAMAAQHRFTLESLEAYLGPAMPVGEGCFAWLIPCGSDETGQGAPTQRIVARCAGDPLRIQQITASGPVIFFSDPHWRGKEDVLLVLLVLACLPVNLLAVHLVDRLVERRRKRVKEHAGLPVG